MTPSLKALTMSHNELLEISAEIFLGLNILEFVDMSHNHISLIQNATFKVLENLTNFKISFFFSFAQLHVIQPYYCQTRGPLYCLPYFSPYSSCPVSSMFI